LRGRDRCGILPRMSNAPGYRIVDLHGLTPVACPCGTSRRGLADCDAFPGTIHLTEIGCDAKPHFHRRLTETYYILRCEPGGQLELDGQRVDVAEGVCIVIPPGVVHRALGRMTILNIVVPKFDPADEYVVPL
jgi:mannose-6-phosphate isomerase-like protein (cupin superfamily)